MSSARILPSSFNSSWYIPLRMPSKHFVYQLTFLCQHLFCKSAEITDLTRSEICLQPDSPNNNIWKYLAMECLTVALLYVCPSDIFLHLAQLLAKKEETLTAFCRLREGLNHSSSMCSWVLVQAKSYSSCPPTPKSRRLMLECSEFHYLMELAELKRQYSGFLRYYNCCWFEMKTHCTWCSAEQAGSDSGFYYLWGLTEYGCSPEIAGKCALIGQI